jgi:hypothetical protein
VSSGEEPTVRGHEDGDVIRARLERRRARKHKKRERIKVLKVRRAVLDQEVTEEVWRRTAERQETRRAASEEAMIKLEERRARRQTSGHDGDECVECSGCALG